MSRLSSDLWMLKCSGLVDGGRPVCNERLAAKKEVTVPRSGAKRQLAGSVEDLLRLTETLHQEKLFTLLPCCVSLAAFTRRHQVKKEKKEEVANASLPPRLASVGGGARPGIFLSKPRLSACKNSTQGPFRTAPAAFVGLSNSAASGRQKAEQREEPTCKEEADEEKGTPHLLAFVGEGCKYCERMAGSLRLVEEQTGERVLRLEVWRNALNFERLDRGRCGGLPFFINLKSLRFVCGATSPRNLLHWAVGLPCNPHEPPPPSQEELDAAQRSTVGPVCAPLLECSLAGGPHNAWPRGSLAAECGSSEAQEPRDREAAARTRAAERRACNRQINSSSSISKGRDNSSSCSSLVFLSCVAKERDP
ncbi:hypothetical protein Esti_002904 [Eimeria stiedai]